MITRPPRIGDRALTRLIWLLLAINGVQIVLLQIAIEASVVDARPLLWVVTGLSALLALAAGGVLLWVFPREQRRD